jgi:mannosyl-oligosaccharide alpha-1,2-mannosidase
MLLAELASCQLEYKYLSKLTGRPEYYERVSFDQVYLRWWC